jgi:hypothetical protein
LAAIDDTSDGPPVPSDDEAPDPVPPEEPNGSVEELDPPKLPELPELGEVPELGVLVAAARVDDGQRVWLTTALAATVPATRTAAIAGPVRRRGR